MYGRMTYSDALEKSEHLKALGQTEIYLDEGGEVPWMVASDITSGASYRLNGPVSFYLIAKVQGLTFKWCVDLEKRDANGRGVSMFDRDRLREVMRKVPRECRLKIATFFEKEVLPEMAKRTAEIREALNAQADSEDCVRGLIDLARADPAKAA